MFLIEKNKVVGPYGFLIEFYQICWSFIKQDMISLFSDFHIKTLDIKRLNYGIITLIPMSEEADKIH
jgi:hypothetical protein